MEIEKNAVLNIVKAARASLRLNEDLRKTLGLGRGGAETVPEFISGMLCDALFSLSHERLAYTQDFAKDSITMKLLKSESSDEEVTEQFIRMAENEGCPDFKYPTPEEMRKAAEEGRGYFFEEDEEI